jgi:hypothetical protein
MTEDGIFIVRMIVSGVGSGVSGGVGVEVGVGKGDVTKACVENKGACKLFDTAKDSGVIQRTTIKNTIINLIILGCIISS